MTNFLPPFLQLSNLAESFKSFSYIYNKYSIVQIYICLYTYHYTYTRKYKVMHLYLTGVLKWDVFFHINVKLFLC